MLPPRLPVPGSYACERDGVSMEITEYFNSSPFRELLDIEVTEAADGHADGRLDLSAKHSSSPTGMVAQGGVQFTLADTLGGAAAVSVEGRPTPTIDMRIDYLSPATTDLVGEADVVRYSSTAVAEVYVEDVDGKPVARAVGVYKVGDLSEDAPWDTAEFETD